LEQANQRFPDRGLTAHDLARLLAACPDTSLRNGERAVELAMEVFQAQKTPLHAETLAMALAEAGRCEEAANLQRMLISTVEQNNDDVPIMRYKTGLARYEKGKPCRPPGLE
jgi:hypothetical protein